MPKTELAKLIMAQDLFRLWGDSLVHAYGALVQGAQKWAGDEVAPVSLLVYLQDSVPSARSLMVNSHLQCAKGIAYITLVLGHILLCCGLAWLLAQQCLANLLDECNSKT